VTRLQQRDAKNDPASGRIEGKIVAINTEKRGLQIGPLFVKLSRATQLEGIGKDDIKLGRTIQSIGKPLIIGGEFGNALYCIISALEWGISAFQRLRRRESIGVANVSQVESAMRARVFKLISATFHQDLDLSIHGPRVRK